MLERSGVSDFPHLDLAPACGMLVLVKRTAKGGDWGHLPGCNISPNTLYSPMNIWVNIIPYGPPETIPIPTLVNAGFNMFRR